MKAVDYEVVKVIGRGAFGEVQLVRIQSSFLLHLYYLLRLHFYYVLLQSTDMIVLLTYCFSAAALGFWVSLWSLVMSHNINNKSIKRLRLTSLK